MRPIATTPIVDVLAEAEERLAVVADVVLSRLGTAADSETLLVLDGERARRAAPDGSHGDVVVPLHALMPVAQAEGVPAATARLVAVGAAEALLESALEALAPRGSWTSCRRSAEVQLSIRRPSLRRPYAVASTAVTFRVPHTS